MAGWTSSWLKEHMWLLAPFWGSGCHLVSWVQHSLYIVLQHEPVCWVEGLLLACEAMWRQYCQVIALNALDCFLLTNKGVKLAPQKDHFSTDLQHKFQQT